MKLKHMIDFVYDEKRFAKGLDPYVPAGVWVVTPTSFDMGYLPGFEEREDEVNWLLNDWIEQGIDPWLKEGFLEYWQESRSPYRGAFGETVETDEYKNSSKCIEDLLGKLVFLP